MALLRHCAATSRQYSGSKAKALLMHFFGPTPAQRRHSFGTASALPCHCLGTVSAPPWYFCGMT